MVDHDAMNAKKNVPRWIRQLKPIGQWPDKTSAPISAWHRRHPEGAGQTKILNPHSRGAGLDRQACANGTLLSWQLDELQVGIYSQKYQVPLTYICKPIIYNFFRKI
jgi:hypothetical protein